MKTRWTEDEVRKLTPNGAYKAAIEASLYKPGMSESDVRNALVRPFGDDILPDWARENEQPAKNLWNKIMVKLPEPIRTFLDGIEFDELILPLLLTLVDNAFERRSYVTKDELAAKMSEFTNGITELIKAQSTPGSEDDIAAAQRVERFTLKWWLDPVGSKPAQKK